MAFPTTVAPVVTDPGGTGTTITPTLPTGHAAGDVIEIWVCKTGVTAWSAPAGWLIKQQIASGGNASTGVTGTLLYRRVLSGDSLPLASPVCNLGATVTRGAIAFVKRGSDNEGVHTAHEWLAFAGTTGSTNPIRPQTVTTRSPENLITHYYVSRAATNAPEPTGSYTQTQELIISGTMVMNVAEKNVANQQTTLTNQDASPTSGVRWVGMISCTPTPDYPYHRAAASATVASGTSVTPALPTGTTASDVNAREDLVIATVEAAGNAIAIAPNTPADWTEITGFSDNTSGNGTTVRKYWALYDGSLDRTFTRPTNGELSAYLNTYHNCDQTSPIGAVNKRQNASSTTSTWDALTRTSTKVAMNVTCVADGVPTFTSPATWTERMDGLGMTCADQPFNATGSTTSASFTLSSASPTLVGLIEIVGVASVGGSLVIQNATHAHSAENLVLTQVHSLVVQDASHSHTAQNNVLTQVHSLAVQDASHAHTAENLALVETHVLTVQDATHDHTAESLVLTQVHSLAVQNASHGHTAENLTLTQVHSLSIDGASHNHTAENVTLTQAHNITIQSASHAHTAENVVLEAEGSLAIQNAAHGHTSENVSLTQVHQLAVSNSSHAHSAENVAITSSSDLVIQSATHGHTVESLALTQVHTLAIQDAAHGHTAENVVLAAEGTLGIQNGSHSHTAENVTLTQVHTLAIQNASHGHSAESPTLIEVYNLTVQSASHAHSAENLTLTQVHSLTVSSSTHSHTAQNLGLGNQNNLLISNSVHAHTTSGILFNWAIPEDVYVVQADNTTFTVVESQIFTVPSEDNIFEV